MSEVYYCKEIVQQALFGRLFFFSFSVVGAPKVTLLLSASQKTNNAHSTVTRIVYIVEDCDFFFYFFPLRRSFPDQFSQLLILLTEVVETETRP